MTQPHIEFNDDHIPLAYLITFAAMEIGFMETLAVRWIVFTEPMGRQCYHRAPKEKDVNRSYSRSVQSR
jgi:hypothetical protein